MTPRLCYPTDVPRGALLVDHDLVIADVAVWNDGQLVAVCDREMRTVLLDPAVQVAIDEDTPERQERLLFALSLLGSDPVEQAPDRPSYPDDASLA